MACCSPPAPPRDEVRPPPPQEDVEAVDALADITTPDPYTAADKAANLDRHRDILERLSAAPDAAQLAIRADDAAALLTTAEQVLSDAPTYSDAMIAAAAETVLSLSRDEARRKRAWGLRNLIHRTKCTP
ncbi:hypothetical protein [Pelagovum pacificum]|uniref:Uncharacterized protein n=1 Tax=Pelagovum pacificum TaxID=2588711 RepID=A0A5C5GFV4_9RHOB|nr:hypothetical protein [Pelagovum pacificum]QQA43934.1 hypothetical protein I8N54_04980 [Pelagovum pacificum]TNY32937.1 hypothetical protein FHY64_06570 [Pelagovum pacificum]